MKYHCFSLGELLFFLRHSWPAKICQNLQQFHSFKNVRMLVQDHHNQFILGRGYQNRGYSIQIVVKDIILHCCQASITT